MLPQGTVRLAPIYLLLKYHLSENVSVKTIEATICMLTEYLGASRAKDQASSELPVEGNKRCCHHIYCLNLKYIYRKKVIHCYAI